MCMYLYVDYALHFSFLFCFFIFESLIFSVEYVMLEIEGSDLMSLWLLIRMHEYT